MTPEEFRARMIALKKEFGELYDREAANIAGRTAARLFRENFLKEGFFGERWQEVRRRQEGRGHVRTMKRGKRRGQTVATGAQGRRRILAGDTGDLRRSISYKLTGRGQATVYTDADAFGSREPYGRVHNEGLRAGRGRGFTMPRRRFMGDHPELRKAIVEELDRKLREIKSFKI
jgi:phage gpG-like protein